MATINTVEVTQPQGWRVVGDSFTLSHYRREPLELDLGRTYLQPSPVHSFGKPRGFWVSVDGEDDWPSWCRSERFREETLTFRHRVVLASDANVKVLASVEAMDVFAAAYLVPAVAYGSGIDWARVAKLYDGIIIPTYQWSRRDRDWYYGWDCASGCIWNLEAIESVAAVEAVRS